MISIMPFSQNSSLDKFFYTITLLIFSKSDVKCMKKEQNLIYYLK